jgi:hypothetical protein
VPSLPPIGRPSDSMLFPLFAQVTAGGLGVVMASILEHHPGELGFVFPAMGHIDYPKTRVEEPLTVVVDGHVRRVSALACTAFVSREGALRGPYTGLGCVRKCSGLVILCIEACSEPI